MLFALGYLCIFRKRIKPAQGWVRLQGAKRRLRGLQQACKRCQLAPKSGLHRLQMNLRSASGYAGLVIGAL